MSQEKSGTTFSYDMKKFWQLSSSSPHPLSAQNDMKYKNRKLHLMHRRLLLMAVVWLVLR